MKLLSQGKVRDLYEGPPGTLVMVASDRISAFDVVMAEAIPDKGRVLTGLTLYWLAQIDSLCPTDFLTADPGRYETNPQENGSVRDLAGRSILVRRADMIPVECVARGYLFGSVVEEYRETGSVGGVGLPAGLQLAERLPEPIFSPAIKAATGHDQNISFDQGVELQGGEVMEQLRAVTLAVYQKGAAMAEAKGMILADTKFEFGWIDGELALCDEVLTPDSSRYWDAESWQPGTSPPSFDKQPLRDFLAASGWDKQPPPPPLPAEVVASTAARYVAAYERVTGEPFAAYRDRMA